jgi:tellurite resistance protein
LRQDLTWPYQIEENCAKHAEGTTLADTEETLTKATAPAGQPDDERLDTKERQRAYLATLQRDLNRHLEQLGAVSRLRIDGEWDDESDRVFKQICRVLGLAPERNARTYRIIAGAAASLTKEERTRRAGDGERFADELRRQFAAEQGPGLGGTPLPTGEAHRAYVAALQRDLNVHLRRLRVGVKLAVDGEWDHHTDRAFHQVCRVLGIAPARTARTFRLIAGGAAARTPSELAKAKRDGAAFAQRLRERGVPPHIVVGGKSMPKDEREQAFIAALQRDLNQHLVRIGSPAVLAVDGEWGTHTDRAFKGVCGMLGLQPDRSMRVYRLIGAALVRRTDAELKLAATKGAAEEKQLREAFEHERETAPKEKKQEIKHRRPREKKQREREHDAEPRLGASDARIAEAIRRHGGRYEKAILRASRQTNIPVAVLCAMINHESGFSNVFGHDTTTRNPVRSPRGSNMQVTEALYKKYLHFRNRGFGLQGVGPMQLTTGSYQDRADELGGCWKPGPNIMSGAEALVGKIRGQGNNFWEGVRAYNGGGDRARAYRKAIFDATQVWEARLGTKGAAGGPRTFRVTKSIIEGDDVAAFQRALNKQLKAWKVGARLEPDGKFGKDTRRAARQVAFGLGLQRDEFAKGFTPELRKVIADPSKRTAGQKARASSRGKFRRRLRHTHRAPDITALLRGKPAPKVPALLRIIEDAAKHGLVVTSTTGGNHAKGSYHYLGRAVDLGVAANPLTPESQRVFKSYQRKLAKHPERFRELIGPDESRLVKNGRFSTTAYSAATKAAHKNHIHCAI